MMVRMTFRSNDTTHENRICCSHFNSKECIAVCGNCSLGCKWEEEVWSKLAHYEDLEESGRLIELPCAVDEFVWVAKNGENTRRVLLDSASDILWEIEHGYTIGYTREEAEAALKERESE